MRPDTDQTVATQINTTADAEDVLFASVAEAARHLHLHSRTVLRLIADGDLNAVNFGRRGKTNYRIRWSELARFIAERSRKS